MAGITALTCEVSGTKMSKRRMQIMEDLIDNQPVYDAGALEKELGRFIQN
jgi:hypothetical protein